MIGLEARCESSFEMTSGCRSKGCCLARWVTVAEAERTTGCSSKLCFGLRVRAVRGAIYRQSSGAGIAHTNALPVGLAQVYGTAYSPRSAANETSARFSSTRRSFARTSMPLALQKKRCPGHWPFARRTDHQDPRRGRCNGATDSGSPQRGSGPRRDPSATLARWNPSTMRCCRQGLRLRRSAPGNQRCGCAGGHPPRSNRRQPIRWSKAIYKHRNLIERFFCRIKHFRRISTRYDKLAERFASFICLVSAFVSTS